MAYILVKKKKCDDQFNYKGTDHIYMDMDMDNITCVKDDCFISLSEEREMF